MSTISIRVRLRSSLRHRLLDLRHFVEQRPALYRLAFRVTVRFPAVKRWLLLRLTPAPIVQAYAIEPEAAVSAMPRRTMPEAPAMTAAEVEHVSYLLRRAIEAKRRD
jgi:hypothetical protein